MPDPIYYAAFLSTFISVTFLTSLTWKEHHPDNPRSFSTLIAQRKELVKQFRIASVVVSTLFTISILFFIAPRIRYEATLFIIWGICYVSELLASLFPERGTIERQLHSLFAYTMGLCMFLTTVVFIFSFDAYVRMVEIWILSCMCILAALGHFDNDRFIFYELVFIFMSHASVLVALTALR